MKQNFPPAKSRSHLIRASLLIFVSLAVTSSACMTFPRKNPLSSPALTNNTQVEGVTRININAATARELEDLPGIGKVTAERIVAHRERYGPFRRPEHLMMVEGISDGKFRALREFITAD